MLRERIIFEAISGSRAYGTDHPGSDLDLRGVFLEPRADLLTLTPPPDQWSDERGDRVHYALRRFLNLALAANPNIIELLFLPEDCVRIVHPCFARVLEQRKQFVSKQAYHTHVRFARAQIAKARGRNKRVHHPQPETPPAPQDFCWILAPDQPDRPPCRPVPLQSSGLNLAHCHAAALEHATGVFRLYEYGETARGVFRGGKVVCEPIPQEDENPRFVALLLYNGQAWERAVKEHQQYWDWRRNRNESRWISQERGELDYDAKNMMHMIRLLQSAESILTQGIPLVRFEGEPLDHLKRILAGAVPYEELIAEADQLEARLGDLVARAPLPDEADRTGAERLLQEITTEWEAQHA